MCEMKRSDIACCECSSRAIFSLLIITITLGVIAVALPVRFSLARQTPFSEKVARTEHGHRRFVTRLRQHRELDAAGANAQHVVARVALREDRLATPIVRDGAARLSVPCAKHGMRPRRAHVQKGTGAANWRAYDHPSEKRNDMPNDPTQPEHGRPVHEDLRERARDEAEQFRRLAEEAREVRDQHREALEMVRQERERLRDAGETVRALGEGARVAAEAARHATIEAVNATADSLQATLEQMHVVEEMRRTLRDIRDVNKLPSN